jgi:predicted signal transduction protein with EAL and GGDEF domain
MSIAEGLSGVLRRSDLVARLGDDEFVALIDDCGDMETASVVARKTLSAISQPHSVDGQELLVTGSIGISIYPMDGKTGDELLKHADTAMFHAKSQGKNTYQFYSKRMAEDASHKLSMEIALRHAIARNELILHYQPKINIKSGEIVGMEALVRWKHPVRGMMAPGEFISLAEERGLIKEIGAWVIMTACKQCRLWQDAGFAPLRCAVNLSARQLQEKNLAAEVKAALDAAGVDGSVLELEITESMLMSEPQQAIATLHQLRAMGISIAIDDFGTGYSSLAYLKDLPATSVKIDRSFINGLPKDPGDTAITKAIIALAQSLGLQVVAEGVETLAQLDHLRLAECTEAQGYYFSRPIPADRLSEWLSPMSTLG